MSKESRSFRPEQQQASEKAAVLNKLSRIEGQVRGIRQAVEADRSTGDQLLQINAVLSALREVAIDTISREVEARLDHMTKTVEAQDNIPALQELRELVGAISRLPSSK